MPSKFHPFQCDGVESGELRSVPLPGGERVTETDRRHRLGGSVSKCLLAGLLAAALCAAGCADFTRGPAADAAADAAPVDDPGFETYVYPILQSDCQSCHSQGQQAGATRFRLTGDAKADRAGVVALVYPDYPAGSLLLQRATGNGHSGGLIFTPDSAEYMTILNWIATLPPTQ